ncbi:MAG: hypothetical protein ABIJ04_02730 [Bacteroidota bacterium]
MRSIYRLDKSFGPGGSFAGLILVIVGLVLIPFYWTGSILIVIGAFAGFTGSGCEIDVKNRRVRPCHLLLGIFKTGKWRAMDSFQTIRVVRTIRSFRTFSLSNRAMNTTQEDYRVVLEAGTPQSRLEMQKFKTREEALLEARKLADLLGIQMLDN